MSAHDALDVFEAERRTIAGQRAMRAALRSKPADRDITVWRQIAISLAHEGPHRLSGLALSGGGIRSATFNLGVLQALNRYRVLGFDYLSTVSGGGYTGGWWSAWIARNPAQPFPPEEGLETWRQSQGLRERPEVHAPTPDPINHLRLFSNYLTPRKGALSRDLWRAVTVVGRNLLITWAALLPMLAVPVLLAQAFFVWAYDARPAGATPIMDDVFTRAMPSAAQLWQRAGAAAALPLAFALFGVFTAFGWLMLQRGNADERERAPRNVQWVIVALAAAAALALLASVVPPGAPSPLAAISLPVMAVAAWRVLRARSEDSGSAPSRDDRLPNRLSRLQSVALVGGIASAVVLGIAALGHELVKYAFYGQHEGIEALAVNAGKYATLITSVGSGIYAGWAGAPAGGSESGRGGRRQRFHALIRIAPVLVLAVLLLATSWIGHSAAVALPFGTWSPVFSRITWIGVIALVGLAVFEPCEQKRASCIAGALLFGAAVLSLAGGRLDGVFGSGVAPLLACGAAALAVSVILAARAWRSRSGRESCFAPHELLLLGAGAAALVATGVGAGLMAPPPQAQLLLGMVGALLTGVMLIGWTADPNALSLHMFYTSRLVRAYLGASNPNRTAHEAEDVTETRAKDDLPLTAISGDGSPGPYHLVNATLNLTAGRDLVIAQRPAAPFLFSRHYCGSSRTGFRPTQQYKGGSLTLGTAVAVSGAAASPIMGAQTPSTALSMLFAFLNVRLGYWTPTPDMPDWRSAQARLWPFLLLREFFAHTADTSRYCYVTDGGHFDNTGVHPLVERGCASIVLTDCGADPDCVFDDLANLVRRCRIDFAADIRFPDLTPFSKATMAASRKPFITGYIRYNHVHLRGLGWTPQQIAESLRRCPADDLQALGWDDIKTDGDGIGVLVVIKPTLRDRLEADVRRYSQQHADFPQQSTGDQWFDEAQFESYRRLGEASGQAAAAEIRKQFPEVVF